MGAQTNLYVAATSGLDAGGGGSSGSPYKTVQYALNNFGRDTTNGNIINLSGDDVLTGTLTIATWGVSTTTAPTVIQNWSGGPDGTGGLNGNNGNFVLITNDTVYFSFFGIKIHNTGTAQICRLHTGSQINGCEVYDNTSANSAQAVTLCGNYAYNCGTLLAPGVAFENYYFEGPTTHPTGGCISAPYVIRNIITVNNSGAVRGISAANEVLILNNSILNTTAGTSYGIMSDGPACVVMNNLVEGYSGAGGIGIYNRTGDDLVYRNNAVYNCTTAYTLNDIYQTSDNETLSASPFAKSGSNTFANRNAYFAPVDTGNVWGGAYPVS